MEAGMVVGQASSSDVEVAAAIAATSNAWRDRRLNRAAY